MSTAARRAVARPITFGFNDFSKFAFSDTSKIGLDKERSRLQLLTDSAGLYPTGANIYARGPLLFPRALRGWTAYGDTRSTPKDGNGNQVTAVKYRVNNGTSDLWWSGAAWAAPGANDWNTLAEIQANFATFPTTARKIRIVWNLSTTDGTLTPYVARASVLFSADVPAWDEEALLRTFVRSLRTNLRPETDVTVSWPTTGTTLAFSALDLEEPPANVQAVVGAWNITDDQDMVADLFSSYVGGTVTLASPVTAGKNVRLRVQYIPTVAVTTHPDFDEIASLPAVLVTGYEPRFVGRDTRGETVVNETTKVALTVPGPAQVEMALEITLVAARQLDLWRLAESVRSHFRRSPILTLETVDATLSLVVTSEFIVTPSTDEIHMHEGKLGVLLRGLEQWVDPIQTGYAVQRLVFAGSLSGASS